MLSNRPYLLRAFYQWITDSICTPILVIDAHYPQCKIPVDYVDEDEIVFNISSNAIRNLKISNELVEFKASFSGVIYPIIAPIKAILALYAEENGEGIFFDGDEEEGHEGINTRMERDLVQLKSIEGSATKSFEKERCSGEASNKSKPFLKLVE